MCTRFLYYSNIGNIKGNFLNNNKYYNNIGKGRFKSHYLRYSKNNGRKDLTYTYLKLMDNILFNLFKYLIKFS